MSERTFKVSGWKPQVKPGESRELNASRQLIREVVFSLHRQKRELLAPLQMPTQPIKLGEIYLEIRSRIAILQSCGQWPYRVHGKRWWDRRVNECACPKYYEDGIPKIVAVSAGLYEPNPQLFVKEALLNA
jgi:hypothetical protein